MRNNNRKLIRQTEEVIAENQRIRNEMERARQASDRILKCIQADKRKLERVGIRLSKDSHHLRYRIEVLRETIRKMEKVDEESVQDIRPVLIENEKAAWTMKMTIDDWLGAVAKQEG